MELIAPPSVRLPRAIDRAGATALLDAIVCAAADERPAIVLTGGDGVFCDGLDLEAMVASSAAAHETGEAVDACARAVAALRAAPKPTVALVDGSARGGGVGLAAACDVVVATERSLFALPEMLWGLVPAVIYPALRDRLTAQQVRLWSLTGEPRTATEAKRAGLVDDVVGDGDLMRAGRQWMRRVSRARPAAVANLRQLAEHGEYGERTEHAAAEQRVALTTRALLDEHVQASLRRFVEGGDPPWGAP